MIDIIICTKNNKGIIKECLDSVNSQTYKEFKVYIADDGSTDGIAKFLKKKYPKVKFVNCGKGPAENRNIALKQGNSKYIVFMDSDAVLKIDTLDKLYKFMEQNQQCGICGGKLLFKNGKIHSAGGIINRIGSGFDRGQNEDGDKYNEVEQVIYACSATMIARRSVIDKVGAFDPDYFYGFEDTDLGWRCNIAGFPVLFDPDIESYHYAHLTVNNFVSGKKRYLCKKNKVLTYLKNYQLTTLLLYSPLFLFAFFYSIVLQSHRPETLKAYFWNLLHLPETLSKRNEINKLRAVSDKELFKKIKFKEIF